MDDKNTDTFIQNLKKCRYFDLLPDDQITSLLPLFEKILLKPNQVLFSQGDASDYIYILIEGQLVSFIKKPSGQAIPVGLINPGETVGELGVLSTELRSLTVESVTDSFLLRLPAATFRELCETHPLFIREVSKIIIERSIKTIRMIGYEKPTYNITIIYPYIKAYPTEVLKYKFKEYLNEYDIEFLATDDIEIDELKTKLKHLQSNNKQLFIFMADWNNEILDLCINKATHFYLVLNENEIQTYKLFTSDLYEKIKRHTQLRLELILLHPNSHKIANTSKFLVLANFHMHHHLHADNINDYKRIARFMTGNAFVLVLGGGGAKGLVHLGVIKAILEKNIPIDAIGGTSIGASIGACFAYAQSFAQAEAFLHKLKVASLYSLKLRNLTWPIISLYSSNPGTRELINIFGHDCIEDMSIPYFSISANLSENREVVHRTGMLWVAIRASVAMPGVFPPVVINNQIHFDGGLLNNLPVDVMREMIGPDHHIIAVSLTLHERQEPAYHFPAVLTMKQALLHRLGLGYRDYIIPPFFETFRNSLLLGSSASEKRNGMAANILIKPNVGAYKTLSLATLQEKALLDIGYKEGLKAIEKHFLAMHKHKK